jgi:hypothetical protein
MDIPTNRAIQKDAMEWFKEHPFAVLPKIPKRIPRVWVSMGKNRRGLHPAWPLLVLYLGGLLVLGCIGMWVTRKDPRWAFMAIMILATWAFLLHTPAYARRTIPLRWPMLLFAGAAFETLIRRYWPRLDKRLSRWISPAEEGESAPEQ